MRLPTRHEVLLERLAILDQHIESLRARVAEEAKTGRRGSPDTERTLATLLDSRAVYEKTLFEFERALDAVVVRRPAAQPGAAPARVARFVASDETLTVLLRAADLCARRGNRFDECVHALLDAAIELTGAPKASLQVFDEATGSLRIAAQRGFDKPFLRFFAEVSAGDGAACGQALGIQATEAGWDLAAG